MLRRPPESTPPYPLFPDTTLFRSMSVTIAASLIGAVYGYVIMPRLDGFAMLAAAYAPVLLLLGTMMASPRWMGIALPTLLGLGSPVLLSDRYRDAFAAYANELGRAACREGGCKYV